ncbi:MAG: hypothetical protein MUO34_13855, partial [Ignavibacteriaceae bacterium]|nr:hypothetical protein [Ignavibacteriaceae bacterium]
TPLQKVEDEFLTQRGINLDYRLGGYAKINNELSKFIKNFDEKTGIIIEPIFTGKMLYGIYDLISKNHIKEGLIIVDIHNGGSQGLEGLKQRQIINKYHINNFSYFKIIRIIFRNFITFYIVKIVFTLIIDEYRSARKR